MDLTFVDVIRRVMAETHLDSERLLAALVATLVEDHLRRDDSAEPRADIAGRIGRSLSAGGVLPGPEPEETLQAVIDLLLTDQVRNEDFAARHQTDAEPDNGLYMDGILCGSRAYEQAALLKILYDGRTLGDKQAQMQREEEELLREDSAGSPAPAAPNASPARPNLRLRRE